MEILTINQVTEMTSLSRSTISAAINEHRFPRQIRLSTRRVGWRRSDLEGWMKKAA
jgi:prophage regulatory protein